MTIQKPNIDVSFKQRAFSFIQRSARGNVILIIKDDTDKTFAQKVYKTITELEVDKLLYTETNLQYIKDTLQGGAFKTTVIRIDITDTFTNGLLFAEPLNTGWIGFADGLPADYEALATWTKAMKTKKKTFMSIVFKPTSAPNSTNVHVIQNEKVIVTDSRGEITGDKYIPSLLGFCAGANVEKGTTYLAMSNLKSVTMPIDVDAELKLGKTVLINDEDVVKIALGINSLTTLGEGLTEDFQFIETIEIQNLMLDDITKEFKTWIGRYKNIYDNQAIFISAINTYFKLLEDANILDKNYDNKADVDIDTQRKAWITVDPKVVDWSDAKVKNNAFKRQLFLIANVKMLQSITDLKFIINMQ
ncbi:phage tail sheath C-terminal domain-containing protein [Clostridium sp. FP1]|uniref:phage tail sheath C-terminal domain-containing protein n=1 Tax=Clostridium sp. FP1 TaxID=2724076 RepID=UPI0013E93BFE|nr:phage tail sheath C-terminal domain-containing protein [Clostridium sp. FP1]MBZ9633190.1 phage tail sheath protein [Clostridium sp. FP1]